MSEWISIKERLPEIKSGAYLSDLVLVAQKMESEPDRKVVKPAYLSRGLADAWDWVDPVWSEVGIRLDRVTHWKPLPDPPQEETR